MTPALMIKKSGVINQVCKLALAEKGPEHTIVQSHLTIIRAGCALRNAISALEALGTVEQRVRKDKQKLKLSGLLTAHSHFCDLVAKLQESKEESDAANDEADTASWDQDAKDAASWMWEAYRVDSACPFRVFVEHEAIYDTLSHHLVVATESLIQQKSKLLGSISEVIGEKSWKKDLTADTALPDAIKAGKKILNIELRGVTNGMVKMTKPYIV